tara:strand:+ start:861 stop:2027 length:1167 start_codon:yes stop_codon:yes gene_type:complete
MKLSKENLESLIREEVEGLSEIDIRGWLQRLKAIKASDFLKDLKQSKPDDFQGIQKPELQRIAGIYKLLIQYAKDDNVQSGEVDKALDMLEAALNKAGTIDKVAGTSPDEEQPSAIPADVQANIIATLTGLKSGEIDSKTGRNALVKSLSNFNLFEALSRNNVFTTINFLNSKMILPLNEELSLFVKQCMKSEILAEIKNVKEITLLSEKLEKSAAEDLRSLIGKLNTANPAQINGITNNIFKILKTAGMITPDSNQERAFLQTRPKRQKAPATNVTREPEEEAEMELGLVGDEPPEGETYSQRAAIGRNTPERAKARAKEQEEEEEYNQAQKRGYSIKNESLYRHLHNLSEHGIIELDDNQKRIVKTMMIAETQLQIDKQLRNMLRR